MKKFQIINAEGIQTLIFQGKVFVLALLTDADAKILFDSGSPYIKCLEESPKSVSTKL